MTSKLALRGIAILYLGLLLLAPIAMMLWTTFAGGVGPVLEALTRPAFIHALKLTLIITIIAPFNPGSFKQNTPSMQNPRWLTLEYAISFFISACTSATRPI